MTIEQIIAAELKVKPQQVHAALELLDGGNTIPFIARYRKEATGTLDEEALRNIEERAKYLRQLEERRAEILAAIEAQEKLTPELKTQIDAAVKMQELEDLYLPYRPKKRTRAQIAREKGLEPLAELITQQVQPPLPLEKLAALHIDAEKGVNSAEEAWQGAMDIVAENISDNAAVRDFIRRELWKNAELASALGADETEAKDFLMYADYAEPVHRLPPHRILALNRGESKALLKVSLKYPAEIMTEKLARKLKIQQHTVWTEMYTAALADSYKRLIFPSLEREIRNELTEKAEKQAISIFAANLRQLLLQQPVAGHTVLGLDPGYRTGCKAAVISPQGKTLATDALYITGSEKQKAQAEAGFLNLVNTYGVTLVAIGNGTASYETEEFTSQMIEKHRLNIAYTIVSEAGASVYSASKLAREELPELDVSLRGAVSIARRVQDPLAELVKIEPKAIGVGQYQHDVNQKELAETLTGVVESCVNHVGVELNTASPALLSYVAGVSPTVAKNIIAWRDEHGSFTARKELLKVSRLGPAAFTQCAGFLRIAGAQNPLDKTSVHPESYKLTEEIIKLLGFGLKDCTGAELQHAAANADAEQIAKALDAGLPTVTDILAALARPGRDPREDTPPPLTRKHVAKLSDLAIGSIVKGRVQNVVDFGAFIDIGLKTSGFAHRSELSDKRFRHPLDVVAVGDIVEAEIISIDEARNRIGLSLKRAAARNKN